MKHHDLLCTIMNINEMYRCEVFHIQVQLQRFPHKIMHDFHFCFSNYCQKILKDDLIFVVFSTHVNINMNYSRTLFLFMNGTKNGVIKVKCL